MRIRKMKRRLCLVRNMRIPNLRHCLELIQRLNLRNLNLRKDLNLRIRILRICLEIGILNLKTRLKMKKRCLKMRIVTMRQCLKTRQKFLAFRACLSESHLVKFLKKNRVCQKRTS